MRPISLHCFGIGDGWPCGDRSHSSFLYRFGQVNLLIDCGEPVSRHFKNTGLKYDAIDRIFISHLHCDHISGFFMLMQGFWLEKRRKDLPVHLPADGIAPVRQMLNAAYIFDELLAFRLQFQPLETGRSVITEDVRVTPFPTTHLEGLRRAFQEDHPQSFAAYSFLLESDPVRIAHSADLGAVDDLAPLVEKPLDLLVCELAHFKPKDLFLYLQGREIKRIVFIHVSRRHWEALPKTEVLARKLLGNIPFSFARDGENITL